MLAGCFEIAKRSGRGEVAEVFVSKDLLRLSGSK